MDWEIDTLKFMGPRHSERHQKLTRSAIAVFAENGVAETNISDISDRAELARTQFYFAWEDRSDCFTFCHHVCLAELERRVITATTGVDTWQKKLLAAIKVVDTTIREEPELAKIVLLDGPASRRDIDIKARQEAEDRLIEGLIALYREAAPDAPEADRRMAHMAIGAATAVATDYLARDDLDLENLANELLVALLSFGFGPGKARSLAGSIHSP